MPSSGTKANWKPAWLGEAYFWGFALAEAGFALTLNVVYFYAIAGASLLFYVLILPMLTRSRVKPAG